MKETNTSQPLLQHTTQSAYRFRLIGEFMFAGRLDANDLVMPFEGISDRHALFFEKEGLWYVVDLASRLGTSINRHQVHVATLLRDGDEIQFDRQRFSFEHPDQLPVPEELAVDDSRRQVQKHGQADKQAAKVAAGSSLASGSSAAVNGTVIMPVVKTGDSWIEIVKGPEAGRRIPLVHGEKIMIARKPGTGNTMVIDDASISRNGHCRLVEDDEGGWRIIDNDSTNGVVVDGRAITTVVLSDGSEIQLGSVVLRYHGTGKAVSNKGTAVAENDFYQNRTIIDNGKTQA
mgnify:CR=1 FL=1